MELGLRALSELEEHSKIVQNMCDVLLDSRLLSTRFLRLRRAAKRKGVGVDRIAVVTGMQHWAVSHLAWSKYIGTSSSMSALSI